MYITSPYILILMHQEQTAFENFVGKGEIAHKDHFFFLFQQFFLLSQIIVSSFIYIFAIISFFATE